MFHLNTPDKPQNILAKRYIRGYSTGGLENFETPEVQEILALFATRPIPVWLDYGHEMKCVHPGPEIQRILINGEFSFSPDLAAEADRWRQLYEDM